ncbi:MAG TPA: MBL fold metallo-hydrolase [Verrucomicrobiales bacterium]|nr:MBL fold metallo-hydrolase [Verrucomicrobiales bacterium]
MVPIPLEDTFVDVLSKAQKGFKLGDADLARRADVSLEELARAKRGEVEEEVLRKLARSLNLGKSSLVELARKGWFPDPLELDGLAQFNTPFNDMTVNSYLVWDSRSKEAVAFDSGANAYGMMATVRTQNLQLKHLFLTHTHGDHVADVDRIRSETGARMWVSEKEPFPEAETFAEGRSFELGVLRIEARSTTGHSVGGTTYVITGLARPVAVVGDALFAASMGGGGISFLDALANNRRKILLLPDDCVVCPGHGPLTTVGWEKKHNPFFPEFQKS